MITRYKSFSRNPVYNNPQAQVNWGYPIAKDLKICILFGSNKFIPINIANIANPLTTTYSTDITNPTITKSLYGIGKKITTNGFNIHYQVLSNLIANGGTKLTVLVKAVNDGGSSGANRVASLEFSGSSNAVGGILTNATNQWRVYFNPGSSPYDVSFASSGTSIPDVIAGTYNSGACKAYKNGFQVNSGSTGTPLSSSGVAWDFFGGESSGTISYTNTMYYAMVWARALSPVEILQLYYDPYCFITFPESKKFFISSPVIVTPLSLTKSDSVNNYSDSATNSGYIRAAISKNDALTLVDAIQLIGGDPFFHIQFSDRLNIADAIVPLVPKIQAAFSDTINNLADSVSKLVGIPIQAFDSQQFNWAEALTTLYVAVIKQLPADSINNLSDSASVIRKNVPILVTLSDTLHILSDAFRFYQVMQVLTHDNFILSDSQTLKFNHLMKISELLTTFLEGLGVQKSNRPAFSDTFSLSDSATPRLSVQQSIQKGDTLNLTSAISTRTEGTYQEPGFLSRLRRYLNDVG
jgi:hypothetical protein